MNITIKEAPGTIAISDESYKNTLENTLQGVIEDVFDKIGKRFDQVKWIIQKKNDLPINDKKNNNNNSAYTKLCKMTLDEKYSACTDGNEIYIALELIETYQSNLGEDVFFKITHKELLDKLPIIIIDELTHVDTGKDHGTKEYDEKFECYKKQYYR